MDKESTGEVALPPPFYDDFEEYHMEERDIKDLMTRLDERTLNIWKLTESLERHQREANGIVRDCSIRITRNTTWVNMFKWGLGLFLPIITAVVLTKLQGWW